MAQNAYLYLKVNGTAVDGESTVASISGVDTSKAIEVEYFDSEVKTAREASTGMATGRRQYSPMNFRKDTDKSSPLIHKALKDNAVIEAEFKFFRPTVEGTQAAHYFTVKIEKGRVASYKLISPYSGDSGGGAQHQDYEEISLVFHTVTYTYEQGGVSSPDDWSAS